MKYQLQYALLDRRTGHSDVWNRHKAPSISRVLGHRQRQERLPSTLPTGADAFSALVAARLDDLSSRAYTLSQLLDHGFSVRAEDVPGADDLMMRIYAAMAQKGARADQ